MPSRRSRPAAPGAAVLTEIVLLVFRVNGQLLAAGDRLVDGLHLTSARWQMLGAIALSNAPRTAPQLAGRMGVSRQAAQKQLDLLLEEGLAEAQSNPGHLRSPLYVLTRKGTSTYTATERLQKDWATRLAAGMARGDLDIAKRLLETLSARLRDS
jgi:DNA-binding MarR family transcriptional regulator